MSIPPIQIGPIISRLASSSDHSSPRARHEHGEHAQRAGRIEQGDSFETREVREIDAHDSAHLRRVAAQKRLESISAPPTPIATPGVIEGFASPVTPAPTIPDVVGDRLAPPPGVDPTTSGIVPSSPTSPTAPTPLTPAPVTPPVVGDRLAPTPGVDPATSGIVPTAPTPLTPARVTPPVVGDRLAPTPEIEKETNQIAPSSDESEDHSTDSIDDEDHATNSIDDEHQANQTFTKADLDQLLGAYGLKSGEQGFTAGLDLNADGVINASDLAALLSRFDGSQPTKQTPEQQLQGLLDAFGTHVKHNGPNGVYDYNGDGVINASDLAELLSRFSSQGSTDAPSQPGAKVKIKSILAAFNSTVGQPGYSAALDLNGDGRIDAADLAERLGRENS